MKQWLIICFYVIAVSSVSASQIPPNPVCSARFKVVSCNLVRKCTLAVLTVPVLVDAGIVGKGCPFKKGDQLESVYMETSAKDNIEGTLQWRGDERGQNYVFIPGVK